MKKAGLIDIKLGQNVVKYRVEAGLSRKELADAIGITHQQMQKYEKGVNRITVSRLMDVSKILNIPISKFLEIDSEVGAAPVEKTNRSISEIMKYINRIEDDSKLDAIKNLVKSLAINEAKNDNAILSIV